MKRSGPIKRKTSLEGGSSLKRTPMKRRSAKRSKVMATSRVPLIKNMIEADRYCEIGPILAEVGFISMIECCREIQGIHERRKRSSGGSMTNLDNLIPACNRCNGIVEDFPEVRDLTGTRLVVREGDPEWESLGARADR